MDVVMAMHYVTLAIVVYNFFTEAEEPLPEFDLDLDIY